VALQEAAPIQDILTPHEVNSEFTEEWEEQEARSHQMTLTATIADRPYVETFTNGSFQQLEPLPKLVWAVGHSAAITTTADDQKVHISKLFNKGLKPDDEAFIDDARLSNLIDEAYLGEVVTFREEGVMSLGPAAKEVIRPTPKYETKGQSELIILGIKPENEIDPPTKKISKSVHRLVDYVAHRANYKANVWLYGEDSTMAISMDIAHDLDLHQPTLIRQMQTARADFGFVEVKRVNNSQKQTVNIRLTKRGLDYLESQAATEELLDDDEVWEVEMKTLGCIALANSLGRLEIAEELQTSRDEKHLFEYTQAQFSKEQARIAQLHEDLNEAAQLLAS